MRTNPCPRCNAPAAIDRFTDECSVRCSRCEFPPSTGKDRNEAVAAWNKRRARRLSYADMAKRIRKEFNALPSDHPDRPALLRSWRWYEVRKEQPRPAPMKPKPRPKKPRKQRVVSTEEKTLKKKIDAYDRQFRAMGSMLAGMPGWDGACAELDRLGAVLLDHPCRSQAQLTRLTRYCHSVGLKISRELLAQKLANIAEARRTSDRTFDNPQTTYEIGILGSDRIPVVEPRPGSKTKYHRKYPLEVMEIGEQILVPGMKDRTGMAGTLAAAQRRYNRRFKTEAVAGGLLVTRVE